MTWAMSALTIVTMWLAGSKSLLAWKIGLANQVLWAWFIWDTKAWGLIPMWLAIIFTYSRNLYRWSKADPKGDEKTRAEEPTGGK